jgi:hypothetical protein
MNCEKVRDRFSSLWEKELSPFEETILKEHLSSCAKCQREFEQFGKTMQWLHSVGEVEAPEEFLAELYKKLEEKEKAFPGEKSRGRWLHFPLSYKLPLEAMAMVAVVFLVLYVTKMMPIDGYRPKEPQQVSSPLSGEKKLEKALGQSGSERDRRELEAPTETRRRKDVEQAKAPVPEQEELKERSVPQLSVEAKKTEMPLPSTNAIGYQKVDSREEKARRDELPSEPGRIESGLDAKQKSFAASKPLEEITLKTSERGKTISQLHDLVRQFGGSVIAVEGDIVLASLPTASISEFEKELEGWSPSGKADSRTAKREAAGSSRFEKGTKRGADREKGKEPARFVADTEDRSTVRIRLLQE